MAMQITLGELTIIAGIALVAGLGALWLAAHLPLWPRPEPAEPADGEEGSLAFLFDTDGGLLDATEQARALIFAAGIDPDGDVRAATLRQLAPRFPDLGGALARLEAEGSAIADAADDGARLVLSRLGAVTRLALSESGDSRAGLAADAPVLTALDGELRLLRRLAAGIPALAWQEDEAGRVTWANRGYLDALADRSGADDGPPVWPLAPLFEDGAARRIAAEGRAQRLAVAGPDGTRRWFDVTALASEQAGETPMFVATPADHAVRAEAALGDFVQTLSKTFAALPTGIAIFNRARELVMFNPAICDLMRLEPEFLSARPSLEAVLDRLRDRQMIPAQRNYAEWRARMATLEQAAAETGFEERWPLPSGQTLRVTGQPHPDGAIAFLFEDVTSEVTTKRRHRAEIEAGQGALDSLDEAIAVFSPDGVLTLSNRAYAALWQSDPSTTFSEVSVTDSLACWRAGGLEAPALAGLADALGAGERADRATLPEAATLADGRRLALRVTPIGGGYTLVGFAPDMAPALTRPARAMVR